MVRKIHITLIARDIREEELNGKIAVVIDVLRATSVIVTALSNGANWVKTVATVEEAFQLKAADVLLGGERHALPIEGFDVSNSPLEYTVEKVLNKGVVLTTTNGTLALSKCGSAEKLLIGAFINHQATANYLASQTKPVELICAGTNGEFSLDDFLCAGLICSTLERSGGFLFDDLGRLAIQSWNQSRPDIHAALANATHYNILKTKEFAGDLDYCLHLDTHNILVCKNKTEQFSRLS
jgi:2-phosphosulfolactate phosphatase